MTSNARRGSDAGDSAATAHPHGADLRVDPGCGRVVDHVGCEVRVLASQLCVEQALDRIVLQQ